MRVVRIVHIVVFVVSVLYFAGYSSAHADESVPREISRKYPEERYIVRAGTGETPEQATESARFEIAKYFESNIRGETIVRQWAQSTTTRGKTIEKRLNEFTNTIMVSAARDISGIEIAMTKKDSDTKTYQVWAALEKNMYADVLQERIRTIDKEVDTKLSQTKNTDLQRVKILSEIVRSLVLRNKAVQDMRLVAPNDMIESRDDVLTAALSNLDNLITDEFNVGLVCKGTVDDKIKSVLVKGIIDAGIRTKEYPDFIAAAGDGVDMVMVVEHRITLRTTSYKERIFHHTDWMLSVKAMEPATEKVIDTVVQNDKVAGAQNESQAVERMVKKIVETQIPNVTTWVYKIIFQPRNDM
jgi:hypothetical protein